MWCIVNTSLLVYARIFLVIKMKQCYERLRDLREDNDLKQKEVAEILNTTQQVYSRYENGLNEIPMHHLVTLSKFYKVSTDYILGLTDNPKQL